MKGSILNITIFLLLQVRNIYLEETAVLIGGWYGTKVESYPCKLDVEDIDTDLDGLGATVYKGQMYYCGGYTYSLGKYRKSCWRNEAGSWREVAEMNMERQYFTMNTVGDIVLAVGGVVVREHLDTIEQFDGTSWIILKDRLRSPRSNHCAVTISDSEIVLLGGYDGKIQAYVEKYHTLDGWTTLPNMLAARSDHDCVLYGDEIVVAGGITPNGGDSVEALNMKTLEWRRLPSLQLSRDFVSMEVVNGDLMVFGGYGTEYSAEVFDGKEWRRVNLEEGHLYHSSVTMPCSEF